MFDQALNDYLTNSTQSWITQMIDQLSNYFSMAFSLSEPFDIINFTRYIQYACSLFLVFLIMFRAVKMAANTNWNDSIKDFVLDSVVAAAAIWLIPMIVTDIITPIMNAFFDTVTIAGSNTFKINMSSLTDNTSLMSAVSALSGRGTWFGIGLAIGFCCAYISSGILYFQYVFAFVTGPILSMFYVLDHDKLTTWLRELVSIFLCRILYIFLFILFVNVIYWADSLVLAYIVGYISILSKGTSMIRRYVYTAGTGKSMSSVGKFAVFQGTKAILKK